jgi:F-type H+-transporting ATPase subunit gamma
MKMVSAAKLRKAQDAIINLRPYSNKLQQILESIIDNTSEEEDYVFMKNKEEINKVLLVVITSNRGLCGSFNLNVIKQSILLAQEKYSKQLINNNVKFFAIGKKGYEYLKKKNFNVVRVQNDLYESLTYENISSVSKLFMDRYASGDYDRIEIIYNQFKNAAVQILTVQQFLPVELKKEKEETGIQKTYTDYIFEPSKDSIKKELIPRSLKLQLFRSMIDSYASEQGARMTAMHKATDNATDLIKQLKLDYNKARQANITNEILEIVSGANALRG